MKYYYKLNNQILLKTEYLSLKKNEKLEELKKNELFKKNKLYRENNLKFVMERNKIIQNIKNNQISLLNIQTKLEILRLKTYPTLRFTDIYYRNRIYYPSNNLW